MSHIPGLHHNKRGCGARYLPLCNIKIKRPYAFLRVQNARNKLYWSIILILEGHRHCDMRIFSVYCKADQSQLILTI